MELEHLSYSSISSYLACARNWALKYVDKEPTYGSADLTIGTAVHGTIEGYLSQSGEIHEGEVVTRPMQYFYDAAWNAALERGEIFWGSDSKESAYNEGLAYMTHRAIVAGVNQLRVARHDDGRARIEEKVELRVPGVPIPIVGYIDIQTADQVPGDFKTSARSWTQDRAQNETQSLFYLAALNQAGRTVPGWKFRHYVIVKTKTPQWQVFEHAHKPGEVFWLFQMIQHVWKGIEAGVYPMNPGSWKCSPVYCDFWTKCRGKYV